MSQRKLNKKARLFISLSREAKDILQQLADEKGLTKSLVIEQYLRTYKKRKKNYGKDRPKTIVTRANTHRDGNKKPHKTAI